MEQVISPLFGGAFLVVPFLVVIMQKFERVRRDLAHPLGVIMQKFAGMPTDVR
ncbi:hypothetical protein ACFFHJ_35210 [Planotetraspora thailandica]|uniref:hypothetical protein n=1 Tax=Planotetraspora thailandica TaxID=487172 RepID=UPI0019504FA0|nr:hypothetical protein [Planotetraspora thailandica]